jgi:hypothetical protein
MAENKGIYSNLEFNNQLPASSEVGLLIPAFMTVRGATTNRYKDYSSLSYQTIDDFDYETGLALVCTGGKYAFINKYFLPVTNWYDEIISHQDLKSKYGIDDDSFDIGDKSVIYVRKAGVVEKIKTGGDLFKMYSVKPDSFYKHLEIFNERWGFLYDSNRYDIGIDGDGLIIPHLDVAIIENYWDYDSVEDEIEMLKLEISDNPMENESHNNRIIDFQFMFRNAQKLDHNKLLEALAIHKRDNAEIPCGYRILRSWEIEESIPTAH